MATNQPTYHYTAEDLQRYLSGSMSAPEMHELEKAALNDSLLADALDGYKSQDTTLTAKHLNEIAAFVQGQEAAKPPVIKVSRPAAQWWRWAAAAITIGILALSSWFFLHSDRNAKSELAQNKATAVETREGAAAPATAEAVTESTPAIAGTKTIPQIQSDSKPSAEVPASTRVQGQKTTPLQTTKRPQDLRVEISSAAEPASTEAAGPAQDKAVGNVAARKQIAVNEMKQEKAEEQKTSKTVLLRGAAPAGKPSADQFFGAIKDANGHPIDGASILVNNRTTTSDPSGRFTLSAPDSIVDATINAIGYQSKQVQLSRGKVAGIVLSPTTSNLNEVVVVGYGARKKKSAPTATAPAINRAKEIEAPAYPKDGWDSFYKTLYRNLGIQPETGSHPLVIQFSFKNEKPENFTILQAPDTLIAQKVVKLIQSGPVWNNTGPGKTAEVRLKVK